MSIYPLILQRFSRCQSSVCFRNYKSVYNLENLYPGSSYMYGGTSQDYSNDTPPEKFTGFIPLDKIAVKYVRSSGPGGQNVNKVSSKAEVRFNVMSATWIPEDLKYKILEKYKKRITGGGDFIVTADESRYQSKNLNNCLEKIRGFIDEVQKPPDPRKELEKEKLNNIDSIHAAHRKRLQKKRIRGFTKAMRTNFD